MVAGRPARGLQSLQNGIWSTKWGLHDLQNGIWYTKKYFARLVKWNLVHQMGFARLAKWNLVHQKVLCKACKLVSGLPKGILHGLHTIFWQPASILQALQTPCGSTRHHSTRLANPFL